MQALMATLVNEDGLVVLWRLSDCADLCGVATALSSADPHCRTLAQLCRRLHAMLQAAASVFPRGSLVSRESGRQCNITLRAITT